MNREVKVGRVVRWIDKKFYPNFEQDWDHKLFRKEILKYVTPDDVLLDAGAGRGNVPEFNFKGKVLKSVGVDPVEDVLSNPYLDEAHMAMVDSMPFLNDETFDLVFSSNVLEHVDKPKDFFLEVSRVTKKGGVFLGLTPNKYHYMPLIARCTPTWFHRYYNKIRGRHEVDTFPTRYMANSYSDIEKCIEGSEFQIEEIRYIDGRPEYLRVSSLSYVLGIIYERFVSWKFPRLKILMLVILRKSEH